MKFERGKGIKNSLSIGKWSDYIKIAHLVVEGTIGHGDITHTVKYQVEGLPVREYLLAVEESTPYIRTKKADRILQTYMKHVFYGKNVLSGKKNPVSEDNIEDLRAGIWNIFVMIDDPIYKRSYSNYIEDLQGKNLAYEGGIWTIPQRKIT